MSDESRDHDLEPQLAAFGQTLESATGEPIRRDAGRHDAGIGDDRSIRFPRRWWAVGGAAAAGVLAVVGLVTVANRGNGDQVEPAAPVTTLGILTPTTTEAVDRGEVPTAPEPVPSDPLGLEADGWRFIERDERPFDFPAELSCPGTDALVELNGAASVRDTLTPPDGTGVDVDVNIIDVGSLDIGNAVAGAFVAFGDCVAAEIGTEPEIGAMSSIRASWFRAGPEFAIATVVGEGSRTIVLEIENGPFSDELIADLARRSAAFLGTATAEPATPATDAPTTTVLVPIESETAALDIPADPLGLEADGWTIAESKVEVLSPSFIPGCTGDRAPAQPLTSRRDQPVPPNGEAWDIHVVFVPPAGYNVDEITSCYRSYMGEGVDVEVVPSSAGEAGWRRLGPDLALAYAVGRDGFGMLMEIKTVGVPFGDELVLDLVGRAVRFLGSTGALSGEGGTMSVMELDFSDDPLGVLANGWSQIGEGGYTPLQILLVGDDYNFESDASSCPGAAAASVLNGLDRYSVLYRTPDDVIVEFSVVQVESRADVDLLTWSSASFAACLAQRREVTFDSGISDSGSGVWSRVGPDHALVVVDASERGLTVLFEIDESPFGDDLIEELVGRAESYLAANS